jgi:Xaa-Pro aminopeptidase
VASVVVDDHVLRDLLAGERTPDLDGLAPRGVATTGLWLFRLCLSLANPVVSGKLSAPVAALTADVQTRFRAQLTALPDDIEVLSLRKLSWSMAELQNRHREAGRAMSAAMVEALAAAHRLGAVIAVSKHDIGSNLRAAAQADGIGFHTL